MEKELTVGYIIDDLKEMYKIDKELISFVKEIDPEIKCDTGYGYGQRDLQFYGNPDTVTKVYKQLKKLSRFQNLNVVAYDLHDFDLDPDETE